MIQTRVLEGIVPIRPGVKGRVALTPVRFDGDKVRVIPYIQDTETNEIVASGTDEFEPAADGTWFRSVVVTDDPNSNPTSFAWFCTYFVGGYKKLAVAFEVPAGTEPLDVGSVVPAQPGGIFGSAVTLGMFQELVDEVNQIQVASGEAVVHHQTEPSAEWIFNHNIGREPDVTVIVNGTTSIVEVVHPSNNQARIKFAAPQVGTALGR